MGQRTISPLVHLVEHPEVNAASPQFAGTAPAIDVNPAPGIANPLRVLVKQGLTNDVWKTAPSSADQIADIAAQQIKEKRLPHSFAQAKERYYASVRLVFQTIKDGAQSTEDLVWRNTCEWLLAGRVTLFVLSPMDDNLNAVKDLQAQAEYTNLRAYFGGEAEIRLDVDTPERTGFRNYGKPTLQDPDVRGSYFPGDRKIVLVDPFLHPAELKRTLKVVVQDAVEPMQASTPAQKFRREMTKRWIAGDHDGALATYDPEHADKGLRTLGFYSPRQNLIINEILENNREMREAWIDQKFQNAALRVRGPQSINPINSVRIYDLCEVIRLKPPDLLKQIKDRIKEAKQLSEEDKREIAAQAELWCQFLRGLDHLTDDEKNGIAALLNIPQVVVKSHIY
jgi:hypothetical protein